VNTDDKSQKDNPVLPDLSKVPVPDRLALLEHLMRGHEREYDATVGLQRVHYESVIRSGESTVKASLLINGGAAVALLALIGNLAAKTPSAEAIPGLVISLTYFATGVFATAVSSGAGHLAGLSQLHERQKLGFAFNVLAILATFSSLACFAAGCYRAARAFNVF
jgi:hypothetical protein